MERTSQSRPALKTTALIGGCRHKGRSLRSGAADRARADSRDWQTTGFVPGPARDRRRSSRASQQSVQRMRSSSSTVFARCASMCAPQFRRDGRFRGFARFAATGAGELETHHTATSSKASRAVGCSAATTQPWWVSSCITRRAVPALRIAAGPLR